MTIIERAHIHFLLFRLYKLYKMVKLALRDLSESEFLSLIRNHGGNISVRGGYRDIDIFKSHRHVKSGSGILSLLGNIGRRALPFISKYILPSVRDLGQNVTSDVIGGQNFKQSIKRRGKETLKRLGARVLSGKGRGKRKRKQSRKMRIKKK